MNEKEKLRIFGNNVRAQRIKEDMSIEELAEKTKISKRYLEKIETGRAKRISSIYVFILADALFIKPYELLKGI